MPGKQLSGNDTNKALLMLHQNLSNQQLSADVTDKALLSLHLNEGATT